MKNILNCLSLLDSHSLGLTLLGMSEIRDIGMLKNENAIRNFSIEPHNALFPFLFHFIERFGINEYISLINEFENSYANNAKRTFLNMILEPRHLSEQTKLIISNRHEALQLFINERTEFNIQLELDFENAYDRNAISAYAEGKTKRIHIGYISKSFNLRIGKLLKESAFPFIQGNFEDIIAGDFSKDNVVIDIYF